MNQTFQALPVPEIIEPTLNHSFKVQSDAIFLKFHLFTHYFEIVCSLMFVMNNDGLRNHQSYFQRSAASSATGTTKSTQSRSETR